MWKKVFDYWIMISPKYLCFKIIIQFSRIRKLSEYSEDEDDYDNQYDGRSKPANAKIRYQELQSTYSNTLTPDWEPREVRERRKNYEEEEDEEELEGEGEEDYEDEISEDEDLLERLEAKYGRIRQSDEEADDDIEDEGEDDIEDEEELEEDDYGSWKRNLHIILLLF